jgi:hypothetical protein
MNVHPTSKAAGASLSSCFLRACRFVYEHFLLLFGLNLLWACAALLVPFRLFSSGHIRPAILAAAVLLPAATAFVHLMVARAMMPLAGITAARYRTFAAVTAICFFVISLFSFNTFFYLASIATRGAGLMNSSFFFLSAWFLLIAAGLSITWIPLCARRTDVFGIIREGLTLFFRNVKAGISVLLLVTAIVFFSAALLSFVFMPVISASVFAFFNHMGKDSMTEPAGAEQPSAL